MCDESRTAGEWETFTSGKQKPRPLGAGAWENKMPLPSLAELARECAGAIRPRLSHAESEILPGRYAMASAMGLRREP
jgi:hypothetical protein